MKQLLFVLLFLFSLTQIKITCAAAELPRRDPLLDAVYRADIAEVQEYIRLDWPVTGYVVSQAKSNRALCGGTSEKIYCALAETEQRQFERRLTQEYEHMHYEYIHHDGPSKLLPWYIDRCKDERAEEFLMNTFIPPVSKIGARRKPPLYGTKKRLRMTNPPDENKE
ncbi:MAG TPA: hypothetical protein VGT41_01220 [Candidatus Babeliales bacterium]|nr:hypothetical protein [Candidatus Babeliales bacterium]